MPTVRGTLSFISETGQRHVWGAGPETDGRALVDRSEFPFHQEAVTLRIANSIGLDWPRLLSLLVDQAYIHLFFKRDDAGAHEITLPEKHPALAYDASPDDQTILYLSKQEADFLIGPTLGWALFIGYKPDGRRFASYSLALHALLAETVLDNMRDRIARRELRMRDVANAAVFRKTDPVITSVEQDNESEAFSYEII